MTFDDLDRRMRVFETQHDRIVPEGVFVVVRLDGRGFTALTKEDDRFEKPFDRAFHEAMLAALRRLMTCGFRTVYGYTQSDELSVLLHPRDSTFGRKERKWVSVLAGEASGTLSLALSAPVAVDARLCELPTEAEVVDYFRWRAEDAHRNALNAYGYWRLRAEGYEATKATEMLRGASVEDKHRRLEAWGIDWNALPAWHRRGAGLRWEEYVTRGVNPLTGQATQATRRRLAIDDSLPEGEAYSDYLRLLFKEGRVLAAI